MNTFCGVRMDKELVNDSQRWAYDQFIKWVVESSSTIEGCRLRRNRQRVSHPLLQFPERYGFQRVGMDHTLFVAKKDITLNSDGKEVSFKEGDLLRKIRSGDIDSYCIYWKF